MLAENVYRYENLKKKKWDFEIFVGKYRWKMENIKFYSDLAVLSTKSEIVVNSYDRRIEEKTKLPKNHFKEPSRKTYFQSTSNFPYFSFIATQHTNWFHFYSPKHSKYREQA